MNETFALVRPLVEFSAEQILQRTNNVWVLQALLGAQVKVRKARNVELRTAKERAPVKNKQITNLANLR